MDYKPILEQFKKKYIEEAGESFSLGIIPLLLLELKSNGADQNIITENFIGDFRSILLPDEKAGVLIKAIEMIGEYKIILPVAVIKSSKESTSTPVIKPMTKPAPVEHLSLKQYEDDDYIPSEEEEADDAFYIPEDQRVSINPEECAGMQIDWEFAKRVGAVEFDE